MTGKPQIGIGEGGPPGYNFHKIGVIMLKKRRNVREFMLETFIRL